MVRFLLPFLVLAGPAEASSVVFVEPMTQKLGPSMIRIEDETTPHVIAAPAPGKAPSVVAYGPPAEAVPPVANETVAAIPDESMLQEPVPMVIRGGIVGGAFAAPAPPIAAEEPTEETAAAPETEQPEPEDAPEESRPEEPESAPSSPPPLLGEPE